MLIDGLSSKGLSFGDNVSLGRMLTVRATGTLKNLGVGVSVGDRSSIGAFSYVGAAGGVAIGNDVIMGPFVGIYAENHIFDDMAVELIREQGVNRSGITVSNNCWIGSSVIILDGVTIGEGCVVGAGSVVVENVDADSVVAGVPA
ncbi:MAG: acyltransferase, partial [Thermoleophilia bacterium]